MLSDDKHPHQTVKSLKSIDLQKSAENCLFARFSISSWVVGINIIRCWYDENGGTEKFS